MSNEAAEQLLIHQVIDNGILRDPANVEEFVHPEAILLPLLDSGKLLTRSELSGVIAARSSTVKSFDARVGEIHRVGDGRYVVTGGLRIEFADGGLKDTAGAWAIVIRDGLLYRYKGSMTEGEARRILDADDWVPTADLKPAEGDPSRHVELDAEMIE